MKPQLNDLNSIKITFFKDSVQFQGQFGVIFGHFNKNLIQLND